MPCRRGPLQELSLAGIVEPQIDLVAGADLEDVAADDPVGPEPAPGVHLALALAIREALAGRLQENEDVLARHDLDRRGFPLDRRAHRIAEVGGVDGLGVAALELVPEFEHREEALHLGRRSALRRLRALGALL